MNFIREFYEAFVCRPAGRPVGVVVMASLGLFFMVLFIVFLLAVKHANARDNGWDDTPPNIRHWFQALMQPDNPAVSCCGEADAYEVDLFEQEGNHYVAIVTDGRSDTFANGSLRPHIDPGTRIPVPNEKMKWDEGNPTIHGYIFIGSGGQIYCFVAPGGV